MLKETNITAASEAPRKPPEQLLWLAVIARAVRDAQGGSTARDCVNARVWLGAYRFRADRELVCELADWNEEVLREWNRKNSTQHPLVSLYPEDECEEALVLHRRKKRGRPRKGML